MSGMGFFSQGIDHQYLGSFKFFELLIFDILDIGQIGKIIDILKKNNCRKVLFAGKVQKPNFKRLKLDLKGIYYIPKIIRASKVGDAAILK